MRRKEERLEVFRKSDFAGCGELLRKALKYARGEWPAMKRVLECGDVELSNNLGEQMMRRIKMNLKNAGNIGSERSARHNAFMYSVIESCKMVRRNVEDYLRSLLERLRSARDGDDLTNCLPCYLPAKQKNQNNRKKISLRKPLKISGKHQLAEKWTRTL